MKNTDNDADKPDGKPRAVPEDDAVWGPAELAQFLGYETETMRTYSTQHTDRVPPRIKGVKQPRWLRSVVIQWARDNSVPVQNPTPVLTTEKTPVEPKRRRGGRPRKVPAH